MDKAVEFLRGKRFWLLLRRKLDVLQQKVFAKILVSADERYRCVEVNARRLVAKNEKLPDVAQVADAVVETRRTTTEEFMASTWKFDAEKTVQKRYLLRSQLSAKYDI